MDKAKILIIEDDKSLVNILKQAFKPEDFAITLASEAREGVDKAKKVKPNLIILDILLPGQSGFEVLKKLKQTKSTKNIPVLILSNLGQDSEIKSGLDMGAEDYMVKADFTVDEVVAKTKKLLEKFAK